MLFVRRDLPCEWVRILLPKFFKASRAHAVRKLTACLLCNIGLDVLPVPFVGGWHLLASSRVDLFIRVVVRIFLVVPSTLAATAHEVFPYNFRSTIPCLHSERRGSSPCAVSLRPFFRTWNPNIFCPIAILPCRLSAIRKNLSHWKTKLLPIFHFEKIDVAVPSRTFKKSVSWELSWSGTPIAILCKQKKALNR